LEKRGKKEKNLSWGMSAKRGRGVMRSFFLEGNGGGKERQEEHQKQRQNTKKTNARTMLTEQVPGEIAPLPRTKKKRGKSRFEIGTLRRNEIRDRCL